MNAFPAVDGPAPRSGDRIAYLVLGMHRSGTSAMTQVLALAGAELPDNVMPSDEHNAKGYFEPWKIAIFNDERLRAGGSAWDDIFAYPCRPLAAREEANWRKRAGALFQDEYGLAQRPLLKDPRVTLLAPLWLGVLHDLGVAARCVIPVRHPLDVAGSLARRNGFPPQKSVLLWTAYMLAAEAYSRHLPRAFVGYDALLADWRAEVARIEAAHGAPLPNLDRRAEREIGRFLTADLRHNGDAGELESLGWAGALARPVQDWFEAAARGEAPDRAPLTAAAEDLARRREEIGHLISPVTRDLDVTRAELLHARQYLALEQSRKQALEREVERLRLRLDELQSACDVAAETLDGILGRG